MRGCLKQKPSDNTKPLIQDPKCGHLLRSSSTPSLKRCWTCQLCHLQNNSVTWHCLNCEGVCVFAPVYTDTLQKYAASTAAAAAPTATAVGLTSSSAAVTITAAKAAATPSNGSKYTGAIAADAHLKGKKYGSAAGHGDPSLVVSGKLHRFNMDAKPDIGVKKCQLCVFNVQLGGSDSMACQHQSRNHLKVLQFPWLQNSNGPVADCYSHQKTYNIYTRYQNNADLLSANRKINKSLSCIDDAFGMPSYYGWSDGLFGEKVLSPANRPSTLTVRHGIGQQSQQRDVAHPTAMMSAYSRQLSVPNTNSEIQQFTNFAAISASENASRQNQCNACGVCNHSNCTGLNRTSCGMINSSRFTITTLSRNGTIGRNSQRSKTPTLPRNGGVFVAVRDWSPAANTSTLQSNYYEVLKNPNNNWPAYENSVTINQMRKEIDPANPATAPGQPLPIYAVVNKMNKVKNKQAYTPLIEPTKYTYVGMGPSLKSSTSTTAVASKDTADPSLYASIRKTSANNIGNSFAASNNNSAMHLDDMRDCDDEAVSAAALTAIDCNNSSHISITSSVDTPGAETSEIYAKVWKGPRKSLDSQKMYVRSSTRFLH